PSGGCGNRSGSPLPKGSGRTAHIAFGFLRRKGGKGLRGATFRDRMGSHKEGHTVVVVSYSGKEINAKLVYYGAGLSGKTTNLEAIYEAVPDTSRGKMVSMKTQSDQI